MAEPATSQDRRKKRDWLSVAGMAAVAGAAAFTSYSGLAGLAEMAGWNHLLAKFLPITVDAYAMTATRVWLSPARLTEKARGFARRNAFGAIIASVVGNALYHAATAHVLSITWPMVVGLSAVPPVTLGLITHLYHTAKDTEPESKSPGPAIADPDAVRAAYPILGNPGALSLPPAPGTAPGAPGRAGAPGPRPSAPRKTAASAPPSAPRPSVAGAGSPAATPGNPGAVARTWAEREVQLLPKAREINAREIADGNGPVSARTLAKELHLSQANAGKLVKALNQAPPQPGTGQPAPTPPVGNPPAGPGNAPPAPAPAQGGIPAAPNPAPVAAAALPGVHPAATPATTPDAAGPDSPSAPGLLGPGALPAQRESPIAHVNGAAMNAP